jgi:hypothetical protein
LNKFFVPNKVYDDRIAICRACTHYKSLLGNCGICKCFMKIKARIATSECADNPKRWEKTTEVEVPDKLHQSLIDEAIEVWEEIKHGRAKDFLGKKRAVELYNTIYDANYNAGTNCGSCLSAISDGIKKVVDDNKK